MQKLTKKLLILLALLLLPIIAGCRTTKIKTGIVLPPKPQRQELKAPETIKDYAEIILYYEGLVEEWEVWGDKVTKIIE